MRLALSSVAALLIAPATLAATAYVVGGSTAVRSIFLNGIDVSSARNQELKNVDVVINEQGDIFIDAPHYQVNEEDTYLPLSKYVSGLNAGAHKPMQKASESTRVGDTMPLKSETTGTVAPLPKDSQAAESKGEPPTDQGNNGESDKAVPQPIAKPGTKVTTGPTP